MALLTAEDVLNKAFSKTKYREGFDQDEVDDFLDEVAHTISSLMAERDDLAARLEAAQSAQPAAGGIQPAPAPSFGDSGASYGQSFDAPAAPEEPAAPAAPSTRAEAAAWRAPEAQEPEPVDEAPEKDSSAAADTDTASSPTAMLAMAQKLHDEYVSSGKEEQERILTEAREKAAAIVAEAESESKARLEEAESESKARLEQLVTERAELERKIDDLRRFERDYRSRLTTYLENLLGDLDHGAGRDREPGDSTQL